MNEYTLLFISTGLIVIGGFVSFIDKWNEMPKNNHKRGIGAATLILAIAGATIGAYSGHDAIKGKRLSDTVASKNQAKAASSQAKLQEVTNKLLQKQDELNTLQNSALDSSSTIIGLSHDLRLYQEQVIQLQQKSFKYILGSEETPAFTASAINDNEILIAIDNVDYNYPLYNVRVKRREDFYPDIGNLPPRGSRILDRIAIASGEEDGWYFTVWYNNIKSLQIEVNATRDSLGHLKIDEQYFDWAGKRIMPPWKKHALLRKNVKPDPNYHYNPSEHF